VTPEVEAWMNNDELFIKELKKGKYWESVIVDRFNDEGLPANGTELTLDKSLMWSDQPDVVVESERGESGELWLEVKSRDIQFSSIEEFPHSTIMLETVSSYDAKHRKPDAVVVISQHTGYAFVIRTSTYGKWRIKLAEDHVRGIEDRFYVIDKKLAEEFDDYVEWCRGND